MIDHLQFLLLLGSLLIILGIFTNINCNSCKVNEVNKQIPAKKENKKQNLSLFFQGMFTNDNRDFKV